MNILITGASGFIGRNLIQSLINSEYDLTACINKNALNFDIKIIKIDYAQMLKITDWLPYLIGIDVVINCVGIIAENRKYSFKLMHHKAPIALFKACEKTHVKRVINISSLGADNSAHVAYHKSKLQADNYLRSSDLEWFILRPSLVYGKGGKSFDFFQKISNFPLVPLIENGQQLIQPVSIEVLIHTIHTCIQSQKINQTIDVVGRKAICFKDWMIKLRKSQFTPYFVKIPIKLIKKLVKLFSPFNLKLMTEDNITMLEQNNVSNYLPLKQFLKNK
ncbi:MAG: NAD(P)H-binding protein [Marinicellaceae bacterium]